MTTKRGFAAVILVLVVALLAIAGGAYYFVVVKPAQTPISQNLTVSPNQPQGSPVTVSAGLFDGKLTPLNRDLGLFVMDELDKANGTQVIYYQAGTFRTGKYAGYKRYVGAKTGLAMSGAVVYVFASNNDKTYIVDGKPVDISQEKVDDWNSPIFNLDKTKITQVDYLDTELPKTINLNSQFALNRSRAFFLTTATNQKDSNGNTILESKLATDFSGYKQLNSPLANTKLYSIPAMNINQMGSGQNITGPFVDGTTQIVAVDSTGLSYLYDLSTPSKIGAYPAEMDTYNTAMQAFRADNTKPVPPYPASPSLRLDNTEIQTTSPLYKKYDIAVPAVCASDVNTLVLKNVSESDVAKIGTSNEGDIFVLTDKNHQLYKDEYKVKVQDADNQAFKEMNKIDKPTYADYVAKNPLILLKDYWGRWVALGEYEILLQGGCGKPVIYLYPTKATEVSLKFAAAVDLDLSIPNYAGGWKVLASPDGTLKDLQPEVTDCSSINYSLFGSEYARQACLTRTYPYLYWAGQSRSSNYPAITSGFIVEKNQVQDFLNSKLDEIGFNAQEKADFMAYWVTEMLAKDAPFYRISFLTSADMDKIAPMHISPLPDSYYRLFIDFMPLETKPGYSLPAQELPKVVRKGFTVLEWGGLKR